MTANAYSTRVGCLLLTGSTALFHHQSINDRELTLQNWSQSYTSVLRDIAQAFQRLVGVTWLRTSPSLGKVLGFPRAPVHGQPGKGHAFGFIQIPPGQEPEIIHTDVLIVGSGCGGGVCAKNLAEAGHKVIVVEKAYHWDPKYLPMTEREGAVQLFANGGAEMSDDSSIGMSSGSVWGGGGTVNWSASLQTQGFVRNEWANQGLPLFTSPKFQASLDRVCDTMGVSTKYIDHNLNNQLLAEGARRLGYRSRDVPQNTGGNKHYCGYCTLGCGAAEKQGPVVSFLPAAARAGARFLEGFDVEKVVIESSSANQKATGVHGKWTSRDSSGGVSGSDRYTRPVTINAKRIIISAGTLNSPLVLQRSGLTNPNIGRHLRLHPANLLTAVYPNQPTPINPWEGGILTKVVDEFDNLDGRGHGVKLECMVMLPSLILPLQPWRSGLQFKSTTAKLPFMTSHLVITRDRDSGRVYPDPIDGKTRVTYTPSAHDRSHALVGLQALARIAYVNGAGEIWTCNPNIPVFVRPSPPSSSTASSTPEDENTDAAFEAWLKTVRTAGLPAKGCSWVSAHQMSSCRMSARPSDGVVDPSGKVWGVDGLYVADASVLPSASGVNPMITNMATADVISLGIAKDLKAAGESSRFEAAAERARL